MGKQPALSVVHHHWFPHENEEQEQKLGTDDVSLFRPEQCFWLVENLLRIRSTTQVWIVIHHQYEWEVSINAGLREGLVSSFPETYNGRADLGGGGRGWTPPPPEMTCDFLIQLVFCQKKTMWFIGVVVKQETSAPPPAWILQVPSLGLSSIFNFS